MQHPACHRCDRAVSSSHSWNRKLVVVGPLPPHHAHKCRMRAPNTRPQLIPFSQFRSAYFVAPYVRTSATANTNSGGTNSMRGLPASYLCPSLFIFLLLPWWLLQCDGMPFTSSGLVVAHHNPDLCLGSLRSRRTVQVDRVSGWFHVRPFSSGCRAPDVALYGETNSALVTVCKT